MRQPWWLSLCCYYLSAFSPMWLGVCWGLLLGSKDSSQEKDLHVEQKRMRTNRNSLNTVYHCICLYRSGNHYLPLPSESYASSFFNCSNSELYREGSNEKHSSQTDRFVRTIGTIEQISMVSKRVPWTGRCWKPCHKKNCLMKLKIIILGWIREDQKWVKY